MTTNEEFPDRELFICIDYQDKVPYREHTYADIDPELLKQYLEDERIIMSRVRKALRLKI